MDALHNMLRHPALPSSSFASPSDASSSRRRLPAAYTPDTGLARRNESRALFGRDDCVSCGASPSCDCASGETCVLTSRTCSQCPQIQCIKSSSGSGASVNAGVIAGPIVAVLVIASVALFWWLRRKKKRDLARLEELADRARKAESAGFHLSNPSSPAPPSSRSRDARASAPLSARSASLQTVGADAEYHDEHGATIRVYSARRGRINADPNHPDNGGVGDPFADHDGSVRSGETDASDAVIPIHFVGSAGAGVGDAAAAQRTLDEARQNLFRPRHAPPRPARSPDLDLRLQPGAQQAHALAYAHDDERSPAPRIRDSFVSDVSGVSGAPSYLSAASSDLHLDAPRIVTSSKVQVGRIVGAEMVQFGARQPAHANAGTELLDASTSRRSSADPFSDRGAAHNVRHLTPAAAHAQALGSSPTDLRFSMGSLAFNRDSVSTVATTLPRDAPGPPLLATPHARRHQHQSVSSEKSGYSLLGSFPMIPPSAATHHIPAVPTLPESVSAMTLHQHAEPHPRLPPPAARAPRPITAASTSSSAPDSVLGAFPFVAPGHAHAGASDGAGAFGDADADDAELRRPGRLTLGMSVASSGLGDFDFSFEKPTIRLPRTERGRD
ncbi:hypothetical protein Q5752_006636 [Cryptotrichosporon argae]